MLQALIPLGAHKAIICERHCTEDDVLHELGLSHLLEAKEFPANEVRQALQKLHTQLGALPKVALKDQHLARQLVLLKPRVSDDCRRQNIRLTSRAVT